MAIIHLIFNNFTIFFFFFFFFHYVSVILKKREPLMQWLFSPSARFKQCYKESGVLLKFAKVRLEVFSNNFL